MSHRLRSFVLSAASVALPSTSVLAQQLSGSAEPGGLPRWTELALPPNFAPGTLVRSLGQSTWFQTPTHVYLWSAITSRWVAVAASPSAAVTQFNDYVTIEDGSTVHGFATRTGTVETLSLSGVPNVHHGPVTSCWLSIAVLGTDAWAFGAFDGRWRHRSLQSGSPTVLVSQTCGLVLDGADLYGVSAYDGAFVAGPHVPGATLVSGGDESVAWSPSSIAGFSAYTSTWDSIATTSASPVAIERGYAMFQDAGQLVAFSTCTGEFATHPMAPGYAFAPGRYVAAASSGASVLAYSSGRNVFQLATFASATAVSVDDEVLAVQDSAGVTAFSVVTSQFSATIPGTFAVTTNDSNVWIDDGANGWAYGSIGGAWSAAPIPSASAIAVVLRNATVLASATGYHAFAGRTGDWTFQPTASAFSFAGPSSGDLFAAFDGVSVHVLDPVIGRWATTVDPSPLASFDIWRQVFVGFDGTSALGFGLMNNRWSRRPVQGAFVSLDANSECGHLLTSTHVYAYSAQGTLSTQSRFPEFSRVQPLGAPFHLIQAAPPGSLVTAFLGHAPAYVPGPAGTLFVDPASLFRRVSLGVVPAGGVLDVSIDLSTTPGLGGTAVHAQTVVQPPSGARWLANSVAPVIL